jgi:hypothetical protein
MIPHEKWGNNPIGTPRKLVSNPKSFGLRISQILKYLDEGHVERDELMLEKWWRGNNGIAKKVFGWNNKKKSQKSTSPTFWIQIEEEGA